MADKFPFPLDPLPGRTPRSDKTADPAVGEELQDDAVRPGSTPASRVGAAEFETVSELTSRLRAHLERGFGHVRVEGEISNWTRSPNGHVYFTLKDGGASLGCVLWRSTARQPSVAATVARLGAGANVRASGRIAVYEPRGQYQLVVNDLTDRGEGELFRRFLELKEKLEREGLFAPERKRPLPQRARRVGIVTSLRAAALRDVLNVIRRRAPGTFIVVEAAVVQGDAAPKSLVTALRRMAARAERDRLDLVIIGRGGGSIEDLAAFNDEALARAIADFPLPIISGVGHEVDWTIADFVADYRAPTPSAAAEAAVPDQRELIRRARVASERLVRAIQRVVTSRRLVVERLARHRAFSDPTYAINRARQRLDDYEERMRDSVERRVRECRRRLDPVARRLVSLAERYAHQPRRRLDSAAARLAALDPRGVLDRGYAMVTRRRGAADHIITSRDEAPRGTRLTIHFNDGTLPAQSLGHSATVEDQTELDL